MTTQYFDQGMWKIGYACDLEGNLKYWNQYVENSKVLKRLPNGELDLEENSVFIHGGDVCDRGNGDLRILDDLIRLKKKYMDRVHFILGNRDVNKLRLPVTLAQSVIAYPPECYWAGANTIEPSYQVNDKLHKLKWTLKATMGSPLSEACRRQELSEAFPGLVYTDKELIESYENAILPGGKLFEYCQLGCMALVLGDTIFVHGAITTLNNRIGFVPPVWNREEGREENLLSSENVDVKTWVNAINEFARREMDDYAQNIQAYVNRLNQISSWDELKQLLWDSVGGYGCPQPGSRLIQCGMGALPDKSSNPGVIYASYLVNGKPNHLEENVANWLKAAGVNKIVVGHQPNADAPLILDDFGVKSISNDSSYSKFVMWLPKDLIHVAVAHHAETVSKVNVESTEFMSVDKFKTSVLGLPAPSTALPSEQADTRNEYHVNEVLLLSEQFPIANPSTPSPLTCVIHGKISLDISYQSPVNEFIGKEMEGWMVKLQGLSVNGQEFYLLSQSEGFNFRNKLVPRQEVEGFFRK